MSSQPITVRVQHRYSQSAERVFDAWLDVDKARRFFFATAQGTMVRAEMDARVGGEFVFVDRRGGEDAEHFGRFLVIERPRRLVFEFAVGTPPSPYTRVTIDIESLGEGCQVTLTHEGVPEEWATQTEGGWSTMLGAVEKVA
jgi:uncharacterized protein YndB with AHSA1/START domain